MLYYDDEYNEYEDLLYDIKSGRYKEKDILFLIKHLIYENTELKRRNSKIKKNEKCEYYTKEEVDEKIWAIEDDYEEKLSYYEQDINELENIINEREIEIEQLKDNNRTLLKLNEIIKKRLKDAGIEDKRQINTLCRKITKL